MNFQCIVMKYRNIFTCEKYKCSVTIAIQNMGQLKKYPMNLEKQYSLIPLTNFPKELEDRGIGQPIWENSKDGLNDRCSKELYLLITFLF